MVYFDHNATTPLSTAAREAWLRATEELPGNPSSPHRIGARAEAALASARESLARLLGCDALDLVWTSGATESNNTVLRHVAATLTAGAEVWISAIEHPSVLEPAKRWFGTSLRLMPVSRAGTLDLDHFKNALADRKPALVAVMAANNETGVLQPWAEMSRLCREAGVPFFCDAAQWLGKLPARGLGGCDFVTGAAHKFGGPRGVGFLKCPAGAPLEPLFRGGPQEDGRRAGTENVAGVLAMLAALEHREAQLAEGEPCPTGVRTAWRNRFEQDLSSRLPGAEILGTGVERLWNTVAALMPEADCRQRWVVKLDKLGFAVSTGSACASGREKPSHVLTAMGRTPAEAARALRFSSGWETPQSAWTDLLEGLARVAGESAS